jgi:hypothetical protein
MSSSGAFTSTDLLDSKLRERSEEEEGRVVRGMVDARGTGNEFGSLSGR